MVFITFTHSSLDEVEDVASGTPAWHSMCSSIEFEHEYMNIPFFLFSLINLIRNIDNRAQVR